MSVTNIFDLDINKEPTNDYYVFFVNQTDYKSRIVQANLYITYTSGGSRTAYALTDETVTISYEYTNENAELTETYEFSCTKATSIGNNIITFVIPNAVVENFGSVKAQVKIYEDASTVLNSVLFSFYVNESLSVGLAPDTELPLLYVAPIIGSVAPTTSTVGLFGQLYVDDVGKNLYYCSNITGSVYIWTLVSGGALVAVINSLTSTSTTDALSAAQGKILEDSKIDKSLYEANTILYAITDNTPLALTIGEQTVIGRLTGSDISSVSIGIANNNILQVDQIDATDNDYAKFTVNGLEGRSYSELRSDINVEDGADVTDATNVNAAGAVMESDYNANTILAATADNVPLALTIGEQTLVGRVTGGNISAISIDSDLSSVSANDDTIPSAKAAKSALDGKVSKSTYDAHTILCAITDNNPLALTVGEQTVVGRVTGGNITTLAIDSDLSSVSSNDDTLPSAKATKAALDGKATAAQGALADTMQHKNLFHNWDFRSNPVNQRGASGNITSGYFYDRWMRYAGTITIAATYLSIPADASIEQRIEGNALAGKVVDVSVMVGGTVIDGSGTFPSSAGTASVTLTGFGTATLGYATGYMYVRFTATNSTRQLQAVKLELGTVSTLANDAPPNYGEQLALCMRYCKVQMDDGCYCYCYTNGYITGYMFPVPMRTTPVATGRAALLLSDFSSATFSTGDVYTQNGVLYFNIPAATVGQWYRITAVTFSADL